MDTRFDSGTRAVLGLGHEAFKQRRCDMIDIRVTSGFAHSEHLNNKHQKSNYCDVKLGNVPNPTYFDRYSPFTLSNECVFLIIQFLSIVFGSFFLHDGHCRLSTFYQEKKSKLNGRILRVQ